jgi:hypothetical protein
MAGAGAAASVASPSAPQHDRFTLPHHFAGKPKGGERASDDGGPLAIPIVNKSPPPPPPSRRAQHDGFTLISRFIPFALRQVEWSASPRTCEVARALEEGEEGSDALADADRPRQRHTGSLLLAVHVPEQLRGQLREQAFLKLPHIFTMLEGYKLFWVVMSGEGCGGPQDPAGSTLMASAFPDAFA